MPQSRRTRATKKGEMGKNKYKTNTIYKTTDHKQRRRTATEEPH